MKKVILLLVVFVFTLAGCQEQTPEAPITITTEVTSSSILVRSTPDEGVTVESISLFRNGSLEKVLSEESLIFTNLESDTLYEIVILYSETGSESTLHRFDVRTLAVATPEISIINVQYYRDTIRFELDIFDPDSVGYIQAVRLYEGDDLVKELTYFTVLLFDNLVSDAAYRVEVEYGYDANDSDENLFVVAETTFSVSSKQEPSLVITDVEVIEDTVYFDFDVDDPDEIIDITSIRLFKDGEIVDGIYTMNKDYFDGVLTGDDYYLVVEYQYNQLLGAGLEEKSVTYTNIDVDNTYNEVVEILGNTIPSRMISNITLPAFDEYNVFVTYDTTCGDVVRSRVVYEVPNNNEECYIIAEIFHDGVTSNEVFMIERSSFDALPQLPQIHINAFGEIGSNKSYVSASLSLKRPLNGVQTTVLEEEILIRLRGNSTLFMPKRSFKFRFEEKQFMLSDYAERSWVLLANFSDHTLVRNAVAMQLSQDLNMAFTPLIQYVDVYLNGEYIGNYMLTDQISVTNDRVDISEHEEVVDTGYLIEYDIGLYREGLENTDDNYFLLNGIPFVLKSPDRKDPTYFDAQKDYIEAYMYEVHDTLQAGLPYDHLIDEASFIDWFIVSEIFKNVDSGYSSVYYYKDKGGVLYMGPLWDFDLSTGNQGHVHEEGRGPTGWWTPRQDKNIFFYYLMQYPAFEEALKNRWNELYEEEILRTLDNVFYYANSMTHSRIQNFERWDVIGKNWDWYTAPEVYDLKTYDEQVWFLHDYLKTRIEWLHSEINN